MLYQKDTLLKSASVTLSIYAFRYKITAPDMQISKTIYCVPQISENARFMSCQAILNRQENKKVQALAPTLSIAPAVGRLCSAQIINADKNPAQNANIYDKIYRVRVSPKQKNMPPPQTAKDIFLISEKFIFPIYNIRRRCLRKLRHNRRQTESKAPRHYHSDVI